MLYYIVDKLKQKGKRTMAKYMNFDFTDGECQHFPIIVRIDKDIDLTQW